jgi:hypothetical protein
MGSWCKPYDPPEALGGGGAGEHLRSDSPVGHSRKNSNFVEDVLSNYPMDAYTFPAAKTKRHLLGSPSLGQEINGESG